MWFSTKVLEGFVSAEHFKQIKLDSAENSGPKQLVSKLLLLNRRSFNFLIFFRTFFGSGVFFADGGCLKSAMPINRASMSKYPIYLPLPNVFTI